MIRKPISKMADKSEILNNMCYILDGAALVGGSEEKFEGTSMKEYAKLGAKKCEQVNRKHRSNTGRHNEFEGLHEVISFHTDDKITPELAAELALSVWRDVLKIDNHKHRWAVHTDTDEIHVHLSWNKRDNNGRIYSQKNDFLMFEKSCHELEIKHGLKVVENRKYLKPEMPTNPQGPNEYRLENRGIKSEKTKFKEAVTSATDKAMTAGEFLEFLDADGFTLITNGNNAYSLEKDGQTFKASEVGASYKALKARFGDDPAFGDTLARLGVKAAPVREMGSIGSDFHDEQSSITEKRIKKSNRVLDTRFDTPDGHDFFYKGTNKKAFEYDPVAGRADFNTNSPMAIKAGLQKLTESGNPQTLHLSGTDDFKRAAWLQFSMMGLDQKGYSLKGFKPTAEDKEKLEKMKNEHPAFKKPIQENNIKALPVEKAPEIADEKPSIGATAENTALKGAGIAVEGVSIVAEGVLSAAVDVFTSKDVVGVQAEMLAEMASLDREARSQQQSAENEAHQNERRRLQQLRPH